MPIPYDPHPQFQDYAHPEKLVSAHWLSARLGTPGLRVVESDEDSLLYDIGHIPTAVRIDWRKDLNNHTIRDYITGEDFAALMSSKGINRDDTVVIYGDKSNWWAAFTFWVFELFGHKDVRILNGGRDAWVAEERDTSFDVLDYPTTYYPIIERNDTELRAFVGDILNSTNTTQLIDVRTEAEYTGNVENSTTLPFSGVIRGGHIPGAVNIPWEKAVHANATFRTRTELDQAFTEVLDKEELITYCQIGERAAHTWFTLKYLLGHEKVRNYDGSWSEWGNMVRMPIALGKEPGSL
ncbi:putative thiosulfate sulfurtransferase [Corynebacterium kutscheri]|uniref:Sulfurtransferase n=1 Tax=Corynebacterium kutscheri TaxID=35755 RepID=A0A0F6QYN1_9CORY|nr:sulfurtransferase [Corynebacterium kutscheri]AKE40677.1 rhodanese-related sulfurtransferase [Corynebacterium kutscheri]VEH11074.1 putative thiosulfate sulfurtransferase [Corynebacterium kutscheri]VEH80448.1 putative thiosulfate sulfurtransferase [Corynebacterium kutscheri]